MPYDSKSIELKWQRIWDEEGVSSLRTIIACLKIYPFDVSTQAAAFIWHVRNYSIGDALSRYYRLRGYNVLQPIGFDSLWRLRKMRRSNTAFTLKTWTYENIDYMK